MNEVRTEGEQEGSAEFWALFQPVEAALRRYVAAHVPGYHQAEDAYQETAMALWKNFGKYDRARPFQAWAFGVARNQTLKSRRDAGRDKLVFQEDIAETVSDRLEACSDALDLRRRFLNECMDRVSKENRSLLRMKYADRKRIDWIAAKLGKTPNAVRLVLFRVREAVGQCLENAARRVRDMEEVPI